MRSGVRAIKAVCGLLWIEQRTSLASLRLCTAARGLEVQSWLAVLLGQILAAGTSLESSVEWLFPGEAGTPRPSARNGVQNQPGILFSLIAQLCSASSGVPSHGFDLSSGTGDNFQFGQPLANGGTDSFGIVLWEVVNARTNVGHPAALQSAGETLGEGE
jgi:hypothetical protein